MNVKTEAPISWLRPFAGYFVLIICVGLAGCGGGGSDGNGSGTVTGVGATGAAGTATLSWVAPSTRVDNTPLPMSEIGGYKVYMGGSVETLVLHAEINDPYQMEFVVDNLDAGAYFFAVTTYNQDGAESDFSSVVNKSI